MGSAPEPAAPAPTAASDLAADRTTAACGHRSWRLLLAAHLPGGALRQRRYAAHACGSIAGLRTTRVFEPLWCSDWTDLDSSSARARARGPAFAARTCRGLVMCACSSLGRRRRRGLRAWTPLACEDASVSLATDTLVQRSAGRSARGAGNKPRIAAIVPIPEVLDAHE